MAKVTKSQLIEVLRKVATLTVSAEVQSVIDYTVSNFEENPRNVTVDDLKDTVSSVEELTGKKLVELLAEATGKEVPKAVAKEKTKVVPVAEKKEDSKKKVVAKKKEEVKVENQDKKVIVPKANKVKEDEPKQEEVKDTKKDTKKKLETVELLANFPTELESKVLEGKLKLRTDLATIKDVVEAYNKEEDIVIATYWTKRHLKQYADSYDPMVVNPGRPKSFEHDLDLIEITYANELVVTGCSLYSYVPQVFLPRQFEIEEDGLRYANGCEFHVYEVVSEE